MLRKIENTNVCGVVDGYEKDMVTVLRRLIKHKHTSMIDEELDMIEVIGIKKRCESIIRVLTYGSINSVWNVETIIDSIHQYKSMSRQFSQYIHHIQVLNSCEVVLSRFNIISAIENFIEKFDELTSRFNIDSSINTYEARHTNKIIKLMLSNGWLPDNEVLKSFKKYMNRAYEYTKDQSLVTCNHMFDIIMTYNVEGIKGIFKDDCENDIEFKLHKEYLDNLVKSLKYNEFSVLHENSEMQYAIYASKYIKIPNETVMPRNGVFLIITCDEFGTRADRKVTPDYKVLLNFRRDQCFGFIGGKVDEGETLMEALKREVMEEISFDIDGYPLRHVASYLDGNFGIHSYHMHVSVGVMDRLRMNALMNSMDGDEVSGLCLTNIFPGGFSGNSELLNNSFSATTKLELQELILTFKPEKDTRDQLKELKLMFDPKSVDISTVQKVLNNTKGDN